MSRASAKLPSSKVKAYAKQGAKTKTGARLKPRQMKRLTKTMNKRKGR